MTLNLSELSKLSIKLPPEVLLGLQLGLVKVPEYVRVGKKLVKARETLRAAIADGDLDAQDALQFLAAYQAGQPLVLPPTTNPVVVEPDEDGDSHPGTLPDLEWPDRMTLELKYAFEPGLDDEGQQALLPTDVELNRNTQPPTIVFPGHPTSVNDRTKITLEANLFKGEKGLHFSDHPHLVNRIEWVAYWLAGSRVVGSLVGDVRMEAGVGWGGSRYIQSGGTLGVASLKGTLKGEVVELFARLTRPDGTVIETEHFKTTQIL